MKSRYLLEEIFVAVACSFYYQTFKQEIILPAGYRLSLKSAKRVKAIVNKLQTVFGGFC